MMKVFVATSQTQGQVPGDFCWTEEGELVMLPLGRCDCPDCGCERSMVGLSSSQATTTLTVENRPDLDLVGYITVVSEALRRDGWLALAGADWVPQWAHEHLELAAQFEVGEILEVHEYEIRRRETGGGRRVA